MSRDQRRYLTRSRAVALAALAFCHAVPRSGTGRVPAYANAVPLASHMPLACASGRAAHRSLSHHSLPLASACPKKCFFGTKNRYQTQSGPDCDRQNFTTGLTAMSNRGFQRPLVSEEFEVQNLHFLWCNRLAGCSAPAQPTTI